MQICEIFLQPQIAARKAALSPSRYQNKALTRRGRSSGGTCARETAIESRDVLYYSYTLHTPSELPGDRAPFQHINKKKRNLATAKSQSSTSKKECFEFTFEASLEKLPGCPQLKIYHPLPMVSRRRTVLLSVAAGTGSKHTGKPRKPYVTCTGPRCWCSSCGFLQGPDGRVGSGRQTKVLGFGLYGFCLVWGFEFSASGNESLFNRSPR